MKKLSTLIILGVLSINLYAGSTSLKECKKGLVVNLDPNGDNFLSVRKKPTSRSAEIDRIYGNGSKVYVCGRSVSVNIFDDPEFKWYKILYGDRCDPKRGSRFCSSGWVYGKYISVIKDTTGTTKRRCHTLKPNRNTVFDLTTNNDKKCENESGNYNGPSRNNSSYENNVPPVRLFY